MSTEKDNIDDLNNPPNDPPSDPQDPPADTVSREAYENVKADLHKYKERSRQLEQDLEKKKMDVLKEKEDWKSIAEQHEQNAKELEQKYSGLQSALVQREINAALSREAQKQGINPNSLSDLELLDFAEVSVDTTSTGKIIVSGADKAIAGLKLKRPHWFTKQVPSINPHTPDLNKPITGKITVADLNAAEAKYKKSKSESDKIAYYDVIKKYKSQQAGQS